MRRNIDGIAVFCIALMLLAVEAASGHFNAFLRARGIDPLRCGRPDARIVLPEMPRVELPDFSSGDR